MTIFRSEAAMQLPFAGVQKNENIEAEKAFLGALMVHADGERNPVFDRVRGFLMAEHFSIPEHQTIYDACVRLISEGKPATPITLKLALEGLLQSVGGVEYLKELADSAVTQLNAGEYGRLIAEMALRREAAETALRLSTHEIGTDPAKLVRELSATAARIIGLSGSASLPPENASDLLLTAVPPREWMLGTLICRGVLTVLAAAGGAGKTSLLIASALSLATGCPLIGEFVHHRSRVLILSLEDSRDEMLRRLQAAYMHHNVNPGDLDGWLLIKSMSGTGMSLATMNGDGAMTDTGTADAVIRIARENNVDVVMVDPFVKISDAPENDNKATDFVCRLAVRIAEHANVAVVLAHHTRKGPAEAGNADNARGARSLIDAARIALTLVPMSAGEADEFGVPEPERRQFIRIDDGKVNLTPANKAKWFHFASVNLGNGTDAYPKGDNVQTLESWIPPDTWQDISHEVANRILDDIAAGLPNGDLYSFSNNAKESAAWRVVQKHAVGKSPKQCRQVINTWRKNGLLKDKPYTSAKANKKFKGVVVVDEKRPSR